MTQQSETQQSETHTARVEHAEGTAEAGEEARHAYVTSAVEQTGKLLRTLSQKVRSVADSLREQQGPSQRVGKTVERVARKLESSADYLTGTPASELRGDVSSVVQRYPVRSLGVCFGLGLVIGSVLRRRGI